jgi:hypothetical protein
MVSILNLIFFVLLYCGWLVALCGYGGLFLKICRWQKIIPVMTFPVYLAFGLSGILGMFFVSLVSTILNFFLPLTPDILLLILLGGIVSAYAFRDQIIENLLLSDRITIFVCSAIVFFLIPWILWTNFGDTGLYHLPAMRWTLESPLPFGLANLHGRFGFNSLWTPLISVIDGFTITLNVPIFLLNGIMTVFFCSIAIMRSIRIYKEHISLQFSDIFLLFSLFPTYIYGIKNINSASPDYAILILSLLILYLYLYAYENQKFLKNIFIIAFLLGLFAFTIKLSGIILFLCTICSLIYYSYREGQFSIKNSSAGLFISTKKIVKTYYAPLLLALLTIIILLIRGIILSGYALYPLPWTGIRDLPWTVPLSFAQGDQNDVIAWARNPGLDYKSSLQNWTWIPKWFAIFAKELCVPIGILLVAIVILFLYKLYFKSSFMKKEPFLHIISISTIGVIFWFLSAPDPRFGAGAIYGLCLGFMAWAIYHYITKGIPIQLNSSKCILIYHVLLIILVVVIYIIYCAQFRVGPPNPPLEFPQPDLDIKLTHEGYIVYFPNGGEAWNSPLPNTPYFQKNISFIYQEGGSLPRVILPA